ncbi:MAG: hypothetical protein RSA99_05865, partial [Oscillospiraceae bacterium]
ARRKITKLLMKYNPKEFPMIKGYNIKEITAWIKNAARGRKLKLEDDALNLLVENMGNNLRMISLELDKLGLLAHPENVVTRKMVQENCITNDDFFDFTNYIVTNQRDKALLKFYKITEKRHPLETLAALQTMLRRWILIKMYGGKKSFIEISRMVNCHEFVAQRTFQEMKNTSLKELVDLKQRLMHAETRIKTFDANDEITEIQNAIMQ